MINRIGEDYFKSQKISESYAHGLRQSTPKLPDIQHNQLIQGISQKGAEKVSPNDVVRQNKTKTENGNDVHRYFSKAAGLKRNNGANENNPGKAVENPSFDTKDRIRMSLEGHEELKAQNENEYDAFRHDNPLNMQAFCKNLGLDANEPSKGASGMSLADRLKAISVNTVGMAW